MSDMEKKFRYKVIIIGDHAVGKTSLLTRYIDDSFSIDYKPTMGANIMTKKFSFPNKEETTAIISFWDIASQENYTTLRKIYFQGTNGILLVYDVTRTGTFQNSLNWALECEKSGVKGVPGILIGNKIDLTKKISSEEGKELASKLNYEFIETSALKDQNVNDAFQFILDELIP